MRALNWTARRFLAAATTLYRVGLLVLALLLRMARRSLPGVPMLYCVGLFVLALLWTSGIQGVWWLELTNIFALCLFAPLVILAPAALLSRRRGLLGAVVIGCAVFVGLFGSQLIPPAARAHTGPRLRVATFNVHSSLAEPQVADIIAAIRAAPADVIALQELSIPAAAAIQQHLAHDYPYQALVPSVAHIGMGLISRYPLDVRSQQSAPVQIAQLRRDDASVTVVNVSLTGPELKRRRLPIVRWVKTIRAYRINKRSREVEQLLRTIEQVRGPLVVAGDFNLSDREPDYAQFAARLHDSFRETSWGFGYTFPSSIDLAGVPISFPLIRIDYIWSAGGVVPAATQVACGGGSDHCMVIAEMQVDAGAVLHSNVRSRSI
jgi:endonuclease/exonuclease/phosphatase (EEP) superfamily protein YafD